MRRVLITFAIALFVLAAGYAGLWFYAERQLAHGFHQWAQASRSNGWEVSSAEPRQGTSPLAAILIVPDLAVSGGEADIPGGLAYRADRVAIEVSLLHPRIVVIRLEGKQRLRLSELPELPFTAGRLRLLMPLQLGEPPRRVDIEGAHLVADMPEGRRGKLTVGRLAAHLQWASAEPGRQVPIAVALRAADIALPAGRWPLGSHVALVSGDAAFSGRVPNVYSLAQRAAAWRDSGGRLNARRVMVTWGSLNLSGNGTLSLDARLQPTATGTARLVDPSDTLSSLVAHGVIGRRTAFAANAVLHLMAHAPEGGGAPVVEVPVSLEDGTVSVGNIPLARLPAIVWPD